MDQDPEVEQTQQDSGGHITYLGITKVLCEKPPGYTFTFDAFQLPGDCICLEGYCGEGCGECAPGYEGYPDCQPCPCNIAGSLNLDPCDEMCVCKVWTKKCADTGIALLLVIYNTFVTNSHILWGLELYLFSSQ